MISRVAWLAGLAEIIFVAYDAERIVAGHTYIGLEEPRPAYRAQRLVGAHLAVGVGTGNTMRVSFIRQVVAAKTQADARHSAAQGSRRTPQAGLIEVQIVALVAAAASQAVGAHAAVERARQAQGGAWIHEVLQLAGGAGV